MISTMQSPQICTFLGQTADTSLCACYVQFEIDTTMDVIRSILRLRADVRVHALSTL